MTIGEAPFKQTHEHQTDGDMFDNSVPCGHINMIENTDDAWGCSRTNLNGALHKVIPSAIKMVDWI